VAISHAPPLISMLELNNGWEGSRIRHQTLSWTHTCLHQPTFRKFLLPNSSLAQNAISPLLPKTHFFHLSPDTLALAPAVTSLHSFHGPCVCVCVRERERGSTAAAGDIRMPLDVPRSTRRSNLCYLETEQPFRLSNPFGCLRIHYLINQ
jgi:hypothetical protein